MTREPARGYSWPPFEKGHELSIKSGTRSERKIAPLRETHSKWLSERYPDIDPSRRLLQAQRLAQIDLAAAWVDEKGIVRNAQGQVYDVCDKLSRWLCQAENWFQQAEAETRERRRHSALDAYLTEGENGDS
jgi:hypothetical protein